MLEFGSFEDQIWQINNPSCDSIGKWNRYWGAHTLYPVTGKQVEYIWVSLVIEFLASKTTELNVVPAVGPHSC